MRGVERSGGPSGSQKVRGNSGSIGNKAEIG